MSLLKIERLNGVHPDLVKVMRRAAELCPFDMQVLEGVRTLERQRKLKEQGASQILDSRHLIGKDGLGHACDIAPVLDTDGDGDKEISWSWPHYHAMAPHIKQAAAEMNVKVYWGGDWQKFKDGPHWELPKALYP